MADRGGNGARPSSLRISGLIIVSVAFVAGVIAIPRTLPTNVKAVTAGGITYVKKSFPIARGEWKTFRAPCPAGKHVLGGGHYQTGGFTDAIVAHSYPYDSDDPGTSPDDGWAAMVGAFEKEMVTIHAQCSDLLPSYNFGNGIAEARSRSPEALAACPPGEVVLSGGTRGHRLAQEVQNTRASVVPQWWVGQLDNLDNRNHDFKVIAVCANATKAGEPFQTDTAGSRLEDAAAVTCPPGSFATGGGVSLYGTDYGTVATIANRPLGTNGWQGWVDNFGPTGANYTVQVMCINPIV